MKNQTNIDNRYKSNQKNILIKSMRKTLFYKNKKILFINNLIGK